MSPLKTLALAAAVSVSAFCLSSLAGAADAEKFDIVGLKLGMTPEEALAVLKAHGVREETIDISRLAYRYGDGLNTFSTEDFTYMIIAAVDERVNGKRRVDNFNVFFSPPPAGGRLVAVRRTIENRADPVTNGQFRAAVLAKYGEPAASTSVVINWKFDGGTSNCISNSPNGTGVGIPDKDDSILNRVFARSGNRYDLDRFRAPRVASLDDCASMLEYQISSGDERPATRVSASMIDVKSWVKAELAASEWVEGLRQEAVRKREGAGSKPAL